LSPAEEIETLDGTGFDLPDPGTESVRE
jgi:hypothetical protein